jgi:hypothetical protein
MDFYERARSEADRSVERRADRTSYGGRGSGSFVRERASGVPSAAKYELDGGSGLIHKARGRTSNRSTNEGVRKYAVELVKTKYADFGPTLATEVLLDKHQLRVGKETLRRWMMAEGLWLSRTQRRTFHQPRLRRESYGELIQIDGSDHRWFEQRGEPCTLLVFIDDATSSLMQRRFVPSESTGSYFEALQGYLATHGCPVASTRTSTRSSGSTATRKVALA